MQAFVLARDDARRGDDHRAALDILVDLRRRSVLHVVWNVTRSFVQENLAQRLDLMKTGGNDTLLLTSLTARMVLYVAILRTNSRHFTFTRHREYCAAPEQPTFNAPF